MEASDRTDSRLPVKDDAATGTALTLVYAALIPFIESAAKSLGGTTSSPQIVVARFAVQFVFISLLLAAVPSLRHPLPRPIWPLLLRGGLLALGSGLLFAGLAVMPLVESSAVFFIQPLLLTCLAAVVLGESVGWQRLVAVLVGLAGALLIIAPNAANIGWQACFPALAALCFSGSALLTRRWAGLANAFVFQLVASGVALILAVAVVLVAHQLDLTALQAHQPTGSEILLLLVVGGGATITNLLLTQAFRITPVSVIGPFLYVEIIGAALVGYWFFGDAPELWTMVGALLVVGAGCYTWRRET
ncbi:MAG: drug/metabolite transporter (DMT)-like permease [Gammaproteobacteria bacterium]|jgi:drug/metabolite transporter (DMT)-like permease